LLADGFSQSHIEYWLKHQRDIRFGKTNNRSVLGSMNEFAFYIEELVSEAGGIAKADFNNAHRRINDLIMRAIQYESGLSAMQTYLETRVAQSE
jgi:hypothetical protein